MFVDSYEHPKRGVEWIYRCQICGETEEASLEEAVQSYPNLVKVEDDARK